MTPRDEERGKLDDRTVVVTGGSDGIGRATVRACVDMGASVIMIGRNAAKTEAAAQSIMSATGRRTVTWEIADLARQEAVRDLAGRLRNRCARIDVLVNNAGALYADRALTADHLERTFALNHLAYFTLTLLLLDRLAPATSATATAPTPGHVPAAPFAAGFTAARVINVASRAHMRALLDIDDLQLERGYGAWRAYANSKLCNLLFTRALARRLDSSRVVVQAVHPGLVRTRFATNNAWRGRLVRRLMDFSAIPAAEGADTVVWLTHANEALAEDGRYWVRRTAVAPSRAAQDDALGEALWRASARLAGLDADRLTASAMVQ